MVTTSDTEHSMLSRKARRMRMAYALNNEQPVRCTIISDQPLFYMDFEGDIIDEPEEFTLTADSSPLSMSARETGAAKTARIMDDFQSDCAFITIDQAMMAMDRDTEFDLALLTGSLERSRLASAFLDCMNRHGGRIVMNDQVENASYDRATGLIHINPSLDKADQLLLAARELRRMWQHRNGALLDPLTFHPDQAILINRAQIADLMSNIVRIAWELQLAGEKECWARIEQSSLEDLGRAFAREAFLDFRTVNNGTANSAVFEAWFLSERCCAEDRRLIQHMLSEYQGYVFDGDSASKALSAEVIGALGSMPFGKNYLAPYINTVVNDALFAEVRDRSNANFLWFIKFERSFREAEQDLQTGDASSHEHSGASHKKRFGKYEKTADIIALPHGAGHAGVERTAAKTGTSGRVIPFKGHLGPIPARD